MMLDKIGSCVILFPTHVGMNLDALFTSHKVKPTPHTRGDEPRHYWSKREPELSLLLPTHVGMNRF